MTQRTLKRIALICMIIDHIGSRVSRLPMWFLYVGRLSAPLFFFCAAEGFSHTRSKSKYLKRLYLYATLMEFGNIVISILLDEDICRSNIFMTLFLGSFLIWVFERWRAKGLFIFLIYQAAIAGLLFLTDRYGVLDIIGITNGRIQECLVVAFGNISGSLLVVEGGALFVALYFALYFSKDNKNLLTITLIVFSFVIYKGTHRAWNSAFVRFNIFRLYKEQYLMLFSLPFMYLYDGTKGKGSKYFYYWFYPVHLWILNIIDGLI